MVPRKLLRNQVTFGTLHKVGIIIVAINILQREIRKIHEEIKEDYLFAVKKSIGMLKSIRILINHEK